MVTDVPLMHQTYIQLSKSTASWRIQTTYLEETNRFMSLQTRIRLFQKKERLNLATVKISEAPHLQVLQVSEIGSSSLVRCKSNII